MFQEIFYLNPFILISWGYVNPFDTEHKSGSGIFGRSRKWSQPAKGPSRSQNKGKVGAGAEARFGAMSVPEPELSERLDTEQY